MVPMLGGGAPSLEPVWVMPERHHRSGVAKSRPVGSEPEEPKPRPRQTRDDHPHSLSWAIHSKLSQGINLRWLGKLGPRAPSLEPAWLMIKGHHPRRVSKSWPVGLGPEGPKPNRGR